MRMFKNIWNTTTGDMTFYGGVVNTFAATKQAKPLFEYLAPLTSKNNN